VSLAHQVVDQIMQYYTGGVILVVSNPVDVVTFMVAKWSGLPEGRVVGTGTVLDSARFRYILSERFNIDVKNIHGYIIGEHGDSQFPAWSATNIAGISVADFCKDVGIIFSEQDKLDIAEKVRVAGADIIKNKGATYYAIAITVNTIVESILHGSGTIRTVGTVMNGLYGLHDVVINLPSILTSNGVRQVLELNLLPEEREKLIYSADQVYTVIHELENL
jgi:L-lactate dehydrogenase